MIPAYNRQGIKVGAFSLFNKEEEEKRFYLFIYPDFSAYHTIKNNIWEDNVFRKAAQPFYDETAPEPVYSNYETFLSEAFDKIPQLRMPDKDRGLFELRLYHSPNDEANRRKVGMFNAEEIDVFDKVGIHSVFYGDILAGSRMPALMYLTWYKDKEAREEAWGKFGKHPDWIGMKDKPEYAHTATNNTSTYLLPLPYSQI
ncbi:MAG: NIPSNAP family protein [Tannerellaceae bacterium]|nr:NIPSNAP family protein [Tannerellaceae bacterium]